MPKVELPAPSGLVAGGLVARSTDLPFLSPASASGLVTATNAPNPNAVIPNSDFTIIERPKRKAVCLLFGDGGTGKTTWGIKYTPQPAVLIGFDGRSEYVEELQKQAGFPVPSVQIPPPSVLQKSDNVKVAARAALDKFFRNFDAAIEASKGEKVRTITIDTGSELGEIITLAIRGTLDAQAAKDFGRSKDQINQIWWRIFGAARAIGQAHLVILSRASSIWEGNEPTGDFRARINDTVRDAVDFSLHIRLGNGVSAMAMVGGTGLVSAGTGGLVPLVPTSGGGGRPVAKDFELIVKKGGNNIEELGNVYRQSDWGEEGPFVYACTRLMPGSQASDWR